MKPKGMPQWAAGTVPSCFSSTMTGKLVVMLSVLSVNLKAKISPTWVFEYGKTVWKNNLKTASYLPHAEFDITNTTSFTVVVHTKIQHLSLFSAAPIIYLPTNPNIYFDVIFYVRLACIIIHKAMRMKQYTAAENRFFLFSDQNLSADEVHERKLMREHRIFQSKIMDVISCVSCSCIQFLTKI